MAKYTKKRHVRRTKKHGKKHGKRRGTRRVQRGGGGKSGLYKEDILISGKNGQFGEEVVTEDTIIGFIDMANNAIRYKNDVPLYKVSIQATPFSMTWTKEGFGIKRSFGRALASIGVISKTENSEDTAANNIAAMYPESEREQIKGQFKDIVKGKVWASVADKIVFARDKISITLGMISGTKNIHITKAEEDEAFKKRIFDMYKAMDDTPITIQDGLTRQDGQEGLTRQDGQVQFMEGIEDIKDV